MNKAQHKIANLLRHFDFVVTSYSDSWNMNLEDVAVPYIIYTVCFVKLLGKG